MSLNQRFEEIVLYLDKTRETGDESWRNATVALIKQLIRAEVPNAKNFKGT